MLSVIICSDNNARVATVHAMYANLLRDVAHEIIRIPDARSMCDGYTRGLRQSRGETLIFSHDDMAIHCDRFAERIAAYLEIYDLFGVAGTTRITGPSWVWSGPPYYYGQIIQYDAAKNRYELVAFSNALRHVGGIQGIDGVLMVTRRSVVERIGFDGETFKGFHHYDLDFSYRAFRAGYRIGVCCDLNVMHYSLGKFDDEWKKSSEVFLRKHAGTITYEPERFSGTLEDAIARCTPPHWAERGI